MITPSSPADDAPGPSPVWVESMGGPLIVVPVSALASWGGCTESGLMAGDATAPDDYDRACAVEDVLAGVIPIDENGAQALVLADEPATSCYLPEHRAFLRWLAADSEAGLRAAADTVLADPATAWEKCGTWVLDGPAVLMDSAEAGADLGVEYPGGGLPAEASVPLTAGRWSVSATQTKVDEENWVGLVRLLPAESCGDHYGVSDGGLRPG
ncbi:Imm21 family immunity protein [Streptomyces sp. NPDC008121]|uniref:Imm21 family immunity protein n=1 Tax=Streptomyces sp. NPDC008121 TaxID=3364809 RepID=UPI0036EEB35D